MQFSDLSLSKPLLNALTDLGISRPTTIQEKAFPVIMSGRDMVGIAQTGTGKTIAYLLPCLRLWKFTSEKHPQILIVVPTRELVVQVAEQVEKLTTYMKIRVAGVYGGENMIRQSPLIFNGLDVLVATPGRLLDFVLNGTLKLRLVRWFIIDEVDEMLSQGFRSQLTRIMDLLPRKRQNLMFSATMTPEIKDYIADFFINPLEIEAARTGTPLENIKQVGIKVPNFNTKINLLEFLLKNEPGFSKVLLFVATKKLADDVYERISALFSETVGIIHSNKTQSHRFEALNLFNNKGIRLLIATDIVARGLDFDDITHAVNFDVPTEAENYMHRIGRTGRVDKKGVAITFITNDDALYRENIQQLMGQKIPMMRMPDEVAISMELTESELPQIITGNSVAYTARKEEHGPAFHEKKEKNKKVNMKIRRKDALKLKYGKPKTRGQEMKK